MLGIIITCYKDNNHKYQDNNPNNLKSNPNKSIKLNHIKSKQKYIDMNLLWKPYKHNIKYKRYRQLGIRFLRENLAQTMEKKKTQGLRPTNLNPLFEIKLHRFTWLFYPKNLLFNTYNLIHIHDVATSYCSLVDSFAASKGLRFSTNDLKIQSLNEKSWMI